VAVWAFPSRKPLIADIDEKALFRRDPYSIRKQVKPYLPTSASYPEPGPVGVIQPNEIVDLTKQLKPDGTSTGTSGRRLDDCPHGTPATGASSRPAPSTALGLECDKFDAKALEDHLGQFVGVLLEKIHPRAKEHGLTTLHMDSWESGAQNWTPHCWRSSRSAGLYARPWLPSYRTGRPKLEMSERFLWDLRLTGRNGAGEPCRSREEVWTETRLSLSIEPYDMNPAGDLDLARWRMSRWRSSGITAWTRPTSCFESTSIAHLMAADRLRRSVYLRGGARAYPWSLKIRATGVLRGHQSSGVPHLCAPALGDAYKPGLTLGRMVCIAPNQTCGPCVGLSPLSHPVFPLLRQGVAVSDVLYLTPRERPDLSAARQCFGGERHAGGQKGLWLRRMLPEDSPGQGRSAGRLIAFPGGSSYRLLVLPQVETMTPGLLAKFGTW